MNTKLERFIFGATYQKVREDRRAMRRLARTDHRTPVYATVAQDMKLDPHVEIHNLFEERPLWPTN